MWVLFFKNPVSPSFEILDALSETESILEKLKYAMLFQVIYNKTSIFSHQTVKFTTKQLVID